MWTFSTYHIALCVLGSAHEFLVTVCEHKGHTKGGNNSRGG